MDPEEHTEEDAYSPERLRLRIQELERSEAALRKKLDALARSEELYRLLAENSSDVIWTMTLDGRFTYVSPSVTALAGFTPEEVMNIPLDKYILPEYMPYIASELLKEIQLPASERSKIRTLEVRQFAKDGSVIDIEVTTSWILDEAGNPVGIQGSTRDIRQRKTMEEELRRHQDELEEMVRERTVELMDINMKLVHEIKERKEIEEDLRISEGDLRKRNDVIMKDLESARLIQKALMPRKIPEYQPLIVDYRYLPLDAVGGDYFSFTGLEEEGGLGVFIGDVTGHGVPAALFLSLVRAASNQACRKNGMHPGAYLELINEEVYRGMPNYYMTALYGVFQKTAGGVMFTFARGGHPYPVLYRRDTDRAESIITPGHLLGWNLHGHFKEETLLMKSGDRLYLYTDGIPDTVNLQRKQLSSSDLFLDMFRGSGQSLGVKLDSIINEVSRFREGAPIIDDIVIIGFEVR